MDSDSDSDDSTSSILSGTVSTNYDELPSAFKGVLVIKIKDSGIGISQRILKSISSIQKLDNNENDHFIPSIELSMSKNSSS